MEYLRSTSPRLSREVSPLSLYLVIRSARTSKEHAHPALTTPTAALSRTSCQQACRAEKKPSGLMPTDWAVSKHTLAHLPSTPHVWQSGLLLDHRSTSPCWGSISGLLSLRKAVKIHRCSSDEILLSRPPLYLLPWFDGVPSHPKWKASQPTIHTGSQEPDQPVIVTTQQQCRWSEAYSSLPRGGRYVERRTD